MLRQLRATLETYRANGGAYEERVIADCGHAPLLEKPDEFRTALLALIASRPLVERPAAPEPAPEPAEAPAQQRRGPLGWFRRSS